MGFDTVWRVILSTPRWPIYQAYGSYAGEAKNGNINLVYIVPTLDRQSYTCYTYISNDNGELALKVSGYTFATLTKNGVDTRSSPRQVA
jgi:hypothetical protein